MVYDVANGETFANVKRWLHEIDQNCDFVSRILGKSNKKQQKESHFQSCINSFYGLHTLLFTFLITVGNKNDDPNSKVVLTRDAQRFADQMGIEYIETSAKENINVEEMFLSITRIVLRAKKNQREKDQSQENSIKLQECIKRKKTKCC